MRFLRSLQKTSPELLLLKQGDGQLFVSELCLSFYTRRNLDC